MQPLIRQGYGCDCNQKPAQIIAHKRQNKRKIIQRLLSSNQADNEPVKTHQSPQLVNVQRRFTSIDKYLFKNGGTPQEAKRYIILEYIRSFMQRKTITIDLETWKELTKLKADLNAESLDFVIKELLKKWKQ